MTSRRWPAVPDRLSADASLQVLILDDERFDRHRLARLCSGLPQECTVRNATDLASFSDALDDDLFDLILVDYQLPDGTGLDALRAVRMSVRNFNAATIMVTGQPAEAIAQEALLGGCADYLTKDEITPVTFRRAVTNAVQKSVLSTQVEAQSFAREEVEAVLQHFAGKMARDIKPMVSRMMRQVRDLRRGEDSDRFDPIDLSCMTMWEMLVELERHDGIDMVTRTLSKGTAAPESVVTPLRKPPSPFARFSH
ncbi:response regulator [Sulfitobacter aestuariivivens]|uniref:Response regulator n=1 Tax=Sulfitobacter aestuariivivens TaxID=2766981 RepID=A0A927D314_9RHOB|nr:response regulator [Sulfitobacter aestuariivivens]MBD3664200.1 response regulator [Sulfitobacter aestuariivivens]